MILTEYDYDIDIAVQREEAYEEGLSKGMSQGISQGISQGAEQAKIETAKNMLLKLIPTNVVVECTGLSLDEVEKLSSEVAKSN